MSLQNVVLHVAIDRLSNIAQFWVMSCVAGQALELRERRLISVLVNHVCYWLFTSFVTASK